MVITKAKSIAGISILILAVITQIQLGKKSVSATVPYTNTRISTDSSGNQQNNYSAACAALSKDGRYAVFASDATNLVSGDTNGARDVFVKDTTTGTTTRVDVSTSGTQANDTAEYCNISYDGRYTTFLSLASNLSANDTNGFRDVYLHDLQTGTTELISQNTSGNAGNSNSGNESAAISRDGRYVVFESQASDLVSGDTNGNQDVFVRDRVLGTTTLLSKSTGGTQGNFFSRNTGVSCDGSIVAFASLASNLVAGDTNNVTDVFVVNRIGGFAITNITIGGNNDSIGGPVLVSCDGSTVVFNSNASNLVAGDTNGRPDTFAYSISTGTITRVDVSTSGSQITTSQSDLGGVSGDGKYVTFSSGDAGLVSGDTNGTEDVFLRDLANSVTERISMRSSSTQATGSSNVANISPDGQKVIFRSTDTGLVASDTNNSSDTFIADTGATPCSL